MDFDRITLVNVKDAGKQVAIRWSEVSSSKDDPGQEKVNCNDICASKTVTL